MEGAQKERSPPERGISECIYFKRTGNCLSKETCPYTHFTKFNPEARIFVPKETPKRATPQEQPPTKAPENMAQRVPQGEYYGEEMYNTYQGYDVGYADEDDDQEYGADPEYVQSCANCPCCLGYVYSCSGEACKYLDMCYCLVRLEVEDSAPNNNH